MLVVSVPGLDLLLSSMLHLGMVVIGFIPTVPQHRALSTVVLRLLVLYVHGVHACVSVGVCMGRVCTWARCASMGCVHSVCVLGMCVNMSCASKDCMCRYGLCVYDGLCVYVGCVYMVLQS